jgi:hypothetical protein
MDAGRTQLVDRQPPVRPRPQRLLPVRTAGGPITSAWAVALGVGWPLAFVLGGLFEPAPAQPEATAPLVVELGSLVFLVAMIMVVAAAVRRQRLAANAGVVAGLVAVAFAISCPVSGHHSFGLWWVGEMVVYTGMLALSAAALGRRARLPA